MVDDTHSHAFENHSAWIRSMRRSYQERRNSSCSVESSFGEEEHHEELMGINRGSYAMPGVDTSDMAADFDRAVDLDEIDGPVYRGGLMPIGGAAYFTEEVYDEAPVYRSFDLQGAAAPSLTPSPEAFEDVWLQSMPPLVERQTAFRR